MGTTSQKLSYLRETKRKIKDKIEDLGEIITNETTFRQYADKLDNIYSNLPKVTGTGTEVTLENTKAGKMQIQPKGNTSQAILPSEYQQVEYIESSGTQYIDTGITYNSSNSYKVDADLKAVEGAQGNYFFGWNAGGACGARDNYYMNTGAGSIAVDTSIRTQIAMKINAGTNTTTDYQGVQPNNTQTGSRTHENLSSYASTRGFPIFGMGSQDGVGNNTYMQLYSISIKVNNTLVRNFIPCYKKSNNEIGLYDLINNIFYTNQGTGTFEKGNDVPNPNYPQEIKNVREDNNVVIRGKNKLSAPNDFISTLNGCTLKNTKGVYNVENAPSQTTTFDYVLPVLYTIQNGDYLHIKNDFASSQIVCNFKDEENNLLNISGNSLSTTNRKVDLSSLAGKTIKTISIYVTANISDFGNFSPMILNTSSDNDYEPYIEPIEKELKLTSKNLYDFNFNDTVFNNVTISKNNGKIVLNGTAKASGVVIIDTSTLFNEQLKGQTCSYSIRINKENKYRCWIGYIKSDNTAINVLNNNINTTARNSDYTLNNFVFPSDAYKNRLVVGVIDGEVYDNFEISVQIELNTLVTSYEPYYNYTLMKDDYITEDCVIHHKRNKIVFDGDENWIQDAVGNEIYWYINILDAKSEDRSINICSNYFKTLMENSKQGFYIHLKNLVIFNHDIANNLQDFKTWLSTHNTIVEYELAEETTETIPNTIPLYNQVKDLYRTIIPSGTIIVETESEEENAQLIVNASALKNWEEEVNE